MKNSTEKMGENELEEILEQVVSLFGYINDKDLFQEFSRCVDWNLEKVLNKKWKRKKKPA